MGVGVNTTVLSETLQVVGLGEVVGRVVRLEKNPINYEFITRGKARVKESIWKWVSD